MHMFLVLCLFCLGPAAHSQTCELWTFRDARVVESFLHTRLNIS